MLEFILQIAGGLTAIILFIVGFVRYAKEQNWKRKEFVAKEIKEFNISQESRNILRILDWGVPTDIKLYPEQSDFDKKFRPIGREDFLLAILPHYVTNHVFTKDDIIIRDNLDFLLDNLERFEHFIKAGLVKEKEFEPYLKYWIYALTEKPPENIRIALANYIIRYNYGGAINLLKRFGKDLNSENNIDILKNEFQNTKQDEHS